MLIQARKHQCQFLLRADYNFKCADVGSYPILACTVQAVNAIRKWIVVGITEASRVGWLTRISPHIVMLALRGADVPELWIIK